MMRSQASVGSFTAFISYSHADRREASKLLRKLQTYRLPIQARGASDKKLGSFFMDREELPAAEDLSSAILEALRASNALAVLCSRSAARSDWVNKEIRAYRQLHPSRPIIPIVITGSTGTADDPSTLFPRELIQISQEPLAADLRKSGDGFRLGFLKVISALTGVQLNQLLRKDARRRNRRVTAITAGLIFLSTTMMTLAFQAERAREDAEARRAEVEGMVDFMINDLKTQLEPVGRLDVLAGVAEQTIEYYNNRNTAELDCPATVRNVHAFHLATNIHLNRNELELAIRSANRALELVSLKRSDCSEEPAFIVADGHSEYWAASPIWRRIATVELGEQFEQSEYTQLLNSLKPYYQRYETAISPLASIPGQEQVFAQEAADTATNFGSVHYYLEEYEDAQRYFLRAIQESEKIALVEGVVPETSIELLRAKLPLLTLANAYGWSAATYEWLEDDVTALAARKQEYLITHKLAYAEPGKIDYPALAQSLQASFAILNIRARTHAPRLQQTEIEELENQIAALASSDPSNQTWQDLYTKVQELRHRFHSQAQSIE